MSFNRWVIGILGTAQFWKIWVQKIIWGTTGHDVRIIPYPIISNNSSRTTVIFANQLPNVYGIWVVKCTRFFYYWSPFSSHYIDWNSIKSKPWIMSSVRICASDIPLSNFSIFLIDNIILWGLSLSDMYSHSFCIIKIPSMHWSSLPWLRPLQNIDIFIMVKVYVIKLPFYMVTLNVIGSLLKVILVLNT